jgi:hypothetical protein
MTEMKEGRRAGEIASCTRTVDDLGNRSPSSVGPLWYLQDEYGNIPEFDQEELVEAICWFCRGQLR